MSVPKRFASPARGRASGCGARCCALVLAALLVAGCANNPPAPVVNRTQTPTRPATAPAPAPQPAAPAQTPSASGVDGATTAPVRGGTIEGRPLEPRGNVRTGPRGFKRPYTDSVYAEMLAEAGAAPPPVAAPASPAGAAPAVATPASPSAPAASSQQAPAGGTPGAAAGAPAAGNPAAGAPAPSPAASAPTGPEGGFAWPSTGRVVQGFDAPKSMGLSIAGKLGDPVLASADGRVIFSGPGPRGYGNLVIVRHEGDTLSVYGHNRALLVKEGATVRRGQRIAEMGDSDGGQPRLLFEIRRAGKPVDPARLLPPR